MYPFRQLDMDSEIPRLEEGQYEAQSQVARAQPETQCLHLKNAMLNMFSTFPLTLETEIQIWTQYMDPIAGGILDW